MKHVVRCSICITQIQL